MVSLLAIAVLVCVSRLWHTEIGGPLVWLGFSIGIIAFSVMGVALFSLLPGKGAEALGSVLFFSNIFLSGLTVPFAPDWGKFLPAASLRLFIGSDVSIVPLLVWTAVSVIVLVFRFRGVFSVDG